jgi:4-amino-4-deoxy-L-arabinose transferase-like glycosyltransferase
LRITQPYRPEQLHQPDPDGHRVTSSASAEQRASRKRLIENVGFLILFVALAFIVLFWRLGVPTFWDPDEAHYAETSRQIVVTGDWWAPFYNEQPFFDKPVLFHQLQGLAMVVLGQNELAARMVPALAALVLVLVTGWFGSVTRSRDTGLVAGLLLITSPGVFGLARYAILDTLFTLFLFGGAALLAVAALRDRPRLQWPGYLSIAIAIMVKGPLALVLCGLAFGLAIVSSSELRKRLLGLRWVTGVVLAVIIASPWFVYMYFRFGEAFVQGYVFDENLRLYASSRFANQPNFYFYFRILAAGLLPWTGLVIGRLYDDVRVILRGEQLDPIELLLWIWTAVIVLFFTLSTFKLDHYVFPAAPSLCLICARAWFDVRQARLSPAHTGSRIGLHLIAPIVVAIGLGCGYFLIARLELSRYAIMVPVVLTVAGASLAALANVRGGLPPRAPWIVLTAVGVTYAGLIAFVLPALERRKVMDDMGHWVVAQRHALSATPRVASYRLPNPAFRFYAEQHVTLLDGPAEARAFFDAPGPFYCLMRKPAFDGFVAQGVPLQIALEREGLSVTSGRVLWRRSLPETRFVLATRAAEAKRP